MLTVTRWEHKMAKRLTKLERANKIVDLQGQIGCLEDLLGQYSYKKLDGKRWNINNIGDSRHFETGYMISKLPKEDQQAINNYIVKKTRAAIRDGRAELSKMGVKL